MNNVSSSKNNSLKKRPIFITGRFRSGSTLLWNIFNSSDNYLAFYEPLHGNLIEQVNSDEVSSSHKRVSSYWSSYVKHKDVIFNHYDQEFSYKNLLLSETDEYLELETYIHHMIELAGDRQAVLQFNRVDFRLPWLRTKFPDAVIINIRRDCRQSWLSSRKHLDLAERNNPFNPDAFELFQWTVSLYKDLPMLLDKKHNHGYWSHYLLSRLSNIAADQWADKVINFEEDILEDIDKLWRKLDGVCVFSEQEKQFIRKNLVSAVKEHSLDEMDLKKVEEIENKAENILTKLGLVDKFSKCSIADIAAAYQKEYEKNNDEAIALIYSAFLKELNDCNGEKTRLLTLIRKNKSLIIKHKRYLELDAELQKIKSSKSWLFLRGINKGYRSVSKFIKSATKLPMRFIKRLIHLVNLLLKKSPIVHRIVRKVVSFSPRLDRHIESIIKNESIIPGNLSKDDYINIKVGNVCIHFQEIPIHDQRGIGRVSRAQLAELMKISNDLENDLNQDDVVKEVFYFPTIHWCPSELPHPSVITIHDVTPMLMPEYFPVESRIWSEKLLPIADQADQIIAISESSAKDVARYLNVSPDRITVVNNGITPLPSPIDNGIKLPENEYVCFLGAQDKHKNLGVIIDCLHLITEKTVDLCVIGYCSDEMARALKRPELEGRIHMLGRLDDADVSYVLSKSLALVFPSLYEGFGLPPMEAALLGVPSICSDRPAMNTLLEGATLFADPLKPDEWAERIDWLLTNQNERVKITNKARDIALHCSWSNNAEKLFGTLVQHANKI